MIPKVPHLRWLVAFALFSAALLNYVDRNVLGLLAVSIQKDLHISNQEYASIINYFLIAYTIANLLSGRVVDKLGVRWSLALFVAWWTIANAFTGMARSLGQICGLRFMLGLGEAGWQDRGQAGQIRDRRDCIHAEASGQSTCLGQPIRRYGT